VARTRSAQRLHGRSCGPERESPDGGNPIGGNRLPQGECSPIIVAIGASEAPWRRALQQGRDRFSPWSGEGQERITFFPLCFRGNEETMRASLGWSSGAPATRPDKAISTMCVQAIPSKFNRWEQPRDNAPTVGLAALRNRHALGSTPRRLPAPCSSWVRTVGLVHSRRICCLGRTVMSVR